ncbi:NrsF family protein [Rhodobacter capsulatus]|uniref:NrsF family protein n=1 Tax=Rhodobacter capsulatus TaxID=1061 RepID=UPI00402827C1
MTTPDQTDAFIDRLAAAPGPAPLRPARVIGLALAGLAAGLGGFYGLFGLRAGLLAALSTPVVAAKTLVPLLLGLLALSATFASTRPGERIPLSPLAAPLLIALGLFVVRALATAPDQLQTELLGHTAGACLLSITSLSLVPLGLGLAALRPGASTRPRLTGALAGLSVGAFAVVGYSLHCPEDSPMFYVIWYGGGIGLCAALGAMAGQRLLRW